MDRIVTVEFSVQVRTWVEARAIVDEVVWVMDVPISREPVLAAAPGTEREWTAIIEFDLSVLEMTPPADAETLVGYVLRNVRGANWRVSSGPGPRQHRVEWDPGKDPTAREQTLVNSAIQAMAVEAAIQPEKDS